MGLYVGLRAIYKTGMGLYVGLCAIYKTYMGLYVHVGLRAIYELHQASYKEIIVGRACGLYLIFCAYI